MKWKEVKSPPKKNGEYLTATKKLDGSYMIIIGYFINGTWLRVLKHFPVTHWMKLPPTPVKNKNKK